MADFLTQYGSVLILGSAYSFLPIWYLVNNHLSPRLGDYKAKRLEISWACIFLDLALVLTFQGPVSPLDDGLPRGYTLRLAIVELGLVFAMVLMGMGIGYSILQCELSRLRDHLWEYVESGKP